MPAVLTRGHSLAWWNTLTHRCRNCGQYFYGLYCNGWNGVLNQYGTVDTECPGVVEYTLGCDPECTGCRTWRASEPEFVVVTEQQLLVQFEQLERVVRQRTCTHQWVTLHTFGQAPERLCAWCARREPA